MNVHKQVIQLCAVIELHPLRCIDSISSGVARGGTGGICPERHELIPVRNFFCALCVQSLYILHPLFQNFGYTPD